jgi:Tfp pilus assembly protein PilF
MLLSIFVLAAALDPSAQATTPASTEAVKSTDLPAGNAGVSHASLEAGLAAFKKRHFNEAEVDFRKALDADPTSAAPYFYLGYTYYKLCEKKRPFHPDKQKAKDMFAKAYAIDPAFRPVWGEPKAAKP